MPGANIRAANGPKGTRQESRVIHLDLAFHRQELDPGFRRDDGALMLLPDSRFPIPDSRFPIP
jgi:hypothetical protein